MDSTLAAGLLERLDAVAATMGVAATDLWGLWLATWWRSLIEPTAAMVTSGLMACGALRLWRHYRDEKRNHRYPDESWAAGSIVVGAVAVVLALAGVFALAEALPYVFEPRLYALDQLRGLLGT